jgi:hypothetical protein
VPLQVLGLTATIGGDMSLDKSQKMVRELCTDLRDSVVITDRYLTAEAKTKLASCTPLVAEKEENIPVSALEEWHAGRCFELLKVCDVVMCAHAFCYCVCPCLCMFLFMAQRPFLEVVLKVYLYMHVMRLFVYARDASVCMCT